MKNVDPIQRDPRSAEPISVGRLHGHVHASPDSTDTISVCAYVPGYGQDTGYDVCYGEVKLTPDETDEFANALHNMAARLRGTGEIK